MIILGADSSSASEKKKSSLKTLYFTAPFGLLDTSLLKFDDDDNNGDGDNDYYDDYEDAVDCDQVARIRLRLVLLAFGYAAWIDTCYCWKRPDILVDVIGTLESSNV